jgi:hypothetical protein
MKVRRLIGDAGQLCREVRDMPTLAKAGLCFVGSIVLGTVVIAVLAAGMVVGAVVNAGGSSQPKTCRDAWYRSPGHDPLREFESTCHKLTGLPKE